jgi:GntR family transcriptional regulator
LYNQQNMSLHRLEEVPGPPIYHQIARVLRSRIFHSLYPDGGTIPSENELTREFGVARLTVRQAIQQLRNEGVLISRRGSGTYVKAGLRMLRPVTFVGYLEDLILQSLTLVTTGATVRTVPAPKAVADAYGLKPRTMVVRLERIRLLDGEPAQYSMNYLTTEIAKGLPLRKLGKGSLTEMLSRDAGIETTSVTQTINAVAAGREAAQALGVKPGTALLTSELVGFEGIRPITYSKVFYRPERVFFTASLTSVARDPRLNRSAGAGSPLSRRRAPHAKGA